MHSRFRVPPQRHPAVISADKLQHLDGVVFVQPGGVEVDLEGKRDMVRKEIQVFVRQGVQSQALKLLKLSRRKEAIKYGK